MLRHKDNSLRAGPKIPKGGYHCSMHLAVVYIHPTPRDGMCRIRIYLSEEDDERDAPVVICSELPSKKAPPLPTHHTR